jgi:hypothetical protein
MLAQRDRIGEDMGPQRDDLEEMQRRGRCSSFELLQRKTLAHTVVRESARQTFLSCIFSPQERALPRKLEVEAYKRGIASRSATSAKTNRNLVGYCCTAHARQILPISHFVLMVVEV